MQQETSKKLQEGEEYLNISVLGQIKLVAFPNKNKKTTSDPDFLGNGIAVWKNKKKATAPGVESAKAEIQKIS